MGRPAARGTLGLAAAILNSCFLLSQAQEIPVTVEPTRLWKGGRQAREVPIMMEPSQPLKGGDVTLTPGGEHDFLSCSWYREEEAEVNRILTYISSSHEQQNGPSFTGRETEGPGCSLHIEHLMLNDTGNYVVSKMVREGAPEVGHVQILVVAHNPGGKGVIVGITVGALAGAVLIGVLF